MATRIEIVGIVQGVGFRPFVYRLASDLGLAGTVGNDSAKVFVELHGPAERVDEFVDRLVPDAPPLARIDHIRRRSISTPAPDDFSIAESAVVGGAKTLVPPDTAVCADCLAEMRDPADRRHGHPFITCTNCGPRFTIITGLPYDRPNTTMAEFPMCDACASEYHDPADRRYHAQPVSCHDCGPAYTFRPTGEDSAETVTGAGAVATARAALSEGKIVAVKGIGGYHLVCDATDDAAVARLRALKHRPDKPFAVMATAGDAERLAEVSEDERRLLRSPARPIVLMTRRPDARLADAVTTTNPLVGVMLPYAPVHHLLLAGPGLESRPLVMTSGNVSGEPLAHDDEDAAVRLAPLCDGFLTHNRRIHVPCDDSVVRVAGGRLLPIRRARGYTPVPVPLPAAQRPIVAVGAELKNTFCVADGGRAWVSQHIGDMENLETLAAFTASLDQFCRLYEIDPAAVVADAHPAYMSTKWAVTNHPHAVDHVQHHRAHVAAVLAEHGVGPDTGVIGFAFDGTGYGDDGTIWGGEVLAGTVDRLERAAHLSPWLLPGGDAAVKNPYRVALALLAETGVDWDPDLAPVQAAAVAGADELGLLARQLERGFRCVPTSSAGRLFDAVASLLGVRHRITYEAQAAIDLEHLAAAGVILDGYTIDVESGVDGDRLNLAPLIRRIVADLRSGRSRADIARSFHQAIVDVMVKTATGLRATHLSDTVALSGGVFQNALLATAATAVLEHNGFRVLSHELVPPNDGGLALGQAYVHAARTASGVVSSPARHV